MNESVRKDLIYPELSYKIVGCAFSLYNEIGAGRLEKIYQKGLATAFKQEGLKFVEQIGCDVLYKGEKIGRGYLDFLVENKVVVELKRGNYFSPADFRQVHEYLRSNNLRLGLLIRFTPDKVLVRRILNNDQATIMHQDQSVAA